MQKRRTVGIYGGSFNPSHEGHRDLVTEALRLLDLDEIWLMVSPQSPHKDKNTLLPFDDRFNMAQLNMEGLARVHVSDLERHLYAGPSQTARLLATLVKAYPDIRFVWLMGGDNWRHFHTWHGWEDIAEMCSIAIFARAGDDTQPETIAGLALAACRRDPDHPWGDTPDWRWVQGNLREVSATDIRAQLRQGKAQVDNLAPSVVAYLRRNRLLLGGA